MQRYTGLLPTSHIRQSSFMFFFKKKKIDNIKVVIMKAYQYNKWHTVLLTRETLENKVREHVRCFKPHAICRLPFAVAGEIAADSPVTLL
jgi:hypothetical protein